MSQKELSTCLKVIDVLATLGLIWIVLYYLPNAGRLFDQGALTSLLLWPVKTYLFSVAGCIPIVFIAVVCWRMFVRIGNDNSFCAENAAALKHACIASVVEGILLVLGIASLILFDVCTVPQLVIMVVLIMGFFGFAIVAAALSRLTLKASLIKDENDLTV